MMNRNHGRNSKTRFVRGAGLLALALTMISATGARAAQLIANGGFENSFDGWTQVNGPGIESFFGWTTGTTAVTPFHTAEAQEGASFAYNDFDRSEPSFYSLHQEVTIPLDATAAILSWTDRVQWDMQNESNPLLPRTLAVELQPAGGGAPILSILTLEFAPETVGDTGYVQREVDLLSLDPLLAGQTVRVNWQQTMPEAYAGPSLYVIDAVSLTVPDPCPPPVPVVNFSPSDGATGVNPEAVTFAWSDPAYPTTRSSVVVPNEYATVEGPGGDLFPLNFVLGNPTLRYQQAYSASAIGRAGQITAIRFRPDSGSGNAFGPAPFSGVVLLGYASTPANALTANLDANSTGSMYICFQGTSSVESANTGAGPRDFDILVPLSSPFLYDPAKGPLLMELQLDTDPGGSALNATSSSDEISRAYEIPGEAGVSSPGYGVVTQFSFEGDDGAATPVVRFGVIDNIEDSLFNNLQAGLDKLATIPGTSGAALDWTTVLGATGAGLRASYDVIYCPGDLVSADYANLQAAVAPGGPLEQFASLGGVLALVVSGNAGSVSDVAPGGVDYALAYHESELFTRPTHPYLTGALISGSALALPDFDGWFATDHGTLGGLPAGAWEILRNADGPSFAEYRHGAGTVILTSLSVGWNVAGLNTGPAFENFLRLASLRTRPAKVGVIPYADSISGSTPIEKLATIPGVVGSLVDFAEINALSAPALRRRFDVIYSPAPNLDDPASYAPLLQAVGHDGALSRYARLGGVLIEGIPFYAPTSDVAPGGVGFVPTFNESVVFTPPDSPYLTGLPYGGTALSPLDFQDWGITVHGATVNYPGSNGQALLRSAGGIALAQYHWGAGTVILDTTTHGIIPDFGPEHSAASFENLLLHGAFHGQYGRCPGPHTRRFDIFLGLSPETLQYAAADLTTPGIGPVPLSPGVTYYWQVQTLTDVGVARGPIWSFTTSVASRRAFGDFDNSGCTEINDFLFLLDYWLVVSPIGGDPIGIDDFLTLLDYWNTGPGC